MADVVSLTYDESHGSQESRYGVTVIGPTDRDGLKAALFAQLPASKGGLFLKSFDSVALVESYTNIWKGDVTYGAGQDKEELQVGQNEFRFSSVKRTIKRTISIASRCYDSTGSISPDDLQIIGWKPKDNRAEGTDVTEYLNAFSWRVAVDASSVTESWRREAGNLRGTVCAAGFFGYDAESVLFDDITGTLTGEGVYTFELTFQQSNHLSGVTIGGISVGEVKGWEIIDVDDMSFEVIDVGAKKRKVPKVDRVKIHQVVSVADWTILSILLGA